MTATTDIDAFLAALEDGADIGWTVTSPDGVVVDSGPVSFAFLTLEAAEQFGVDLSTDSES